jgi:signal peptidase complex subunit 3
LLQKAQSINLTKADLSSLFNWNTKQVFVWITAKWPSPKAGAPPSEAVIWDQIIPADPAQNPNLALERRKSKTKPATKEERGKISLRNQKGKYQVTDMAGKLAEYGNATLELGWNVQPWVGPLTWTNRVGFGTWEALKGGKSGLFDFPALKPKKVVVSEGGSSTKA